MKKQINISKALGASRSFTVKGSFHHANPIHNGRIYPPGVFLKEPMNNIVKCVYYADSITMFLSCEDKTKEVVKRLCFIACVQCDDGISPTCIYPYSLKIVIKSLKDMDRIIPEFKKMFKNNKNMKDEYVLTMRQFFGEV